MKSITRSILIVFTFCLSANINAQVPEKAEDISPLLIGETLPKASLRDANGKTIEFNTIIKEKPTVLVFYRGGWCPYCNLQLGGLVQIERDILDLGYQIVAISPDDYQNLKITEKKVSINYKLYSDPNGKFIQEIGIAFQTPSKLKEYLTNKGNKGETSAVLPVPTVMILNREGKILFEYINPNYKERISEEMLLAVVKSLKK
jgi:peroxiredoxin